MFCAFEMVQLSTVTATDVSSNTPPFVPPDEMQLVNEHVVSVSVELEIDASATVFSKICQHPGHSVQICVQ